MTKRNMRSLGATGEQVALEYLINQGYKIIGRNFNAPTGELDIIADDRGVLVFVEVKSRTNDKFGTPSEAVGKYKQNKIIRTAEIYIAKNNLYNKAVRFDIVEIMGEKINILKNAFGAN